MIYNELIIGYIFMKKSCHNYNTRGEQNYWSKNKAKNKQTYVIAA